MTASLFPQTHRNQPEYLCNVFFSGLKISVCQILWDSSMKATLFGKMRYVSTDKPNIIVVVKHISHKLHSTTCYGMNVGFFVAPACPETSVQWCFSLFLSFSLGSFSSEETAGEAKVPVYWGELLWQNLDFCHFCNPLLPGFILSVIKKGHN